VAYGHDSSPYPSPANLADEGGARTEHKWFSKGQIWYLVLALSMDSRGPQNLNFSSSRNQHVDGDLSGAMSQPATSGLLRSDEAGFPIPLDLVVGSPHSSLSCLLNHSSRLLP
jgi:hypothetical protein